MKKILEDIKKLNIDFKDNMNKLSLNILPKTRSIFDDFQNIFNIKTLTAIGLATAATFANADTAPIDAIQKSFDESLKIQNIHYNPELPTYYENKDILKSINVVLKNEFWQGNVVTLIGNKNIEDYLINEKYKKQITALHESDGEAFYITQIDSSDETQNKINGLYSNKDDYLHYFKNETFNQKNFLDTFDSKHQKYFDDFITFHEMAHGSFEQQMSRMDKNRELNISGTLKNEVHSDISSLLMIANKHKLNYKDFRELTIDLIKVRSLYAMNGDLSHNSSSSLAELINTLDKNKSIYENMSSEKISAFSAYFVNNIFEQDSDNLVKNISKIGMPTDVMGFMKSFEKLAENLKTMKGKGENIFSNSIEMDGFLYVSAVLEDVYFKRNPDILHEFARAIVDGKIMVAAKIKTDMYDHFENMSEKELQIYSVQASTMIQNIDFNEYTQYISKIAKPEKIMNVHTTSILSKHLEDNKEQVNKMIKNKI